MAKMYACGDMGGGAEWSGRGPRHPDSEDMLFDDPFESGSYDFEDEPERDDDDIDNNDSGDDGDDDDDDNGYNDGGDDLGNGGYGHEGY